jgi:hypothetical protein
MARTHAWNEQLPDPSAWQPSTPGDGSLRSILRLTCQGAQRRIVAAATHETQFNVQNFDAGPAVEDIVRQELRQITPHRYDISAGVVDDANGRTAGEVDIVIANSQWAPKIKVGATPTSRRVLSLLSRYTLPSK